LNSFNFFFQSSVEYFFLEEIFATKALKNPLSFELDVLKIRNRKKCYFQKNLNFALFFLSLMIKLWEIAAEMGGKRRCEHTIPNLNFLPKSSILEKNA